MPCILIIDDRPDIRLSLVMLLTDNGYQSIEAESLAEAKKQLNNNNISLILLDMNYSLDTTSGEEGLNFLSWKKESGFDMPVVAMTAWSNVDLAVKAMQLGAGDFIEKPWKNKRLLQIIQQQLAYSDLQTQNSKLKQQLNEVTAITSNTYQWRSESMLQLISQINAVAKADVCILLTGDNGTGKSELARYIHQLSARQNEAFVSVNMGAISGSLFESEMFGHKKGAFTDAKTNRIGRFELAESGCLFLDEIGNIPLAQQAKLLRVLETGEYEVLGSSKTRQTDIRIISATNANITEMIATDQFREDLYYRLNTIELRVPSLRERFLDIIPLAEFFMSRFALKYQRQNFQLSESAKQTLLAYHWPGNIRELSHLIERAVLLTQKQVINSENLHLANPKTPDPMPFMTLEAAEVQLIKMALEKTDQHIPDAAKLLGLTKSSLYRRIGKYALV